MDFTLTLGNGDRRDIRSPTFAGYADRVMFERRFGTSSMKIEEMASLFDDQGNMRKGGDFSEIHEEWLAFLCWRAARRLLPDLIADDFDAFLEQIVDIELQGTAPAGTAAPGQEAENPTAPAPLPG
jgi:hypothetical protein